MRTLIVLTLVALSLTANARVPEKFRWTVEVKGDRRKIAVGDLPFQFAGKRKTLCYVTQTLPAPETGVVYRALTCASEGTSTSQQIACRTGGTPQVHRDGYGDVILRCDPKGDPKPDPKASLKQPVEGWVYGSTSYRSFPDRFKAVGLKPGEVILQIDDLPLWGWGEQELDGPAFYSLLSHLIPEQSYALKLRRDGKPIDLTMGAVEILPLKIELTVKTPKLPANRPFAATWTLINPSSKEIGWTEMSCSWRERLQVEGEGVHFASGWGCDKNVPHWTTLGPGQREERAIDLISEKPGAHRFRVVFSPLEGRKYQSNEVAIDVTATQ